MTYLLDANTCIKFLNGQSDSVRRRFESLSTSDLSLCSIVKAELLYGAMKSARPQANLEKLHLFFGRFVSFPFDDAQPRSPGGSAPSWRDKGSRLAPTIS